MFKKLLAKTCNFEDYSVNMDGILLTIIILTLNNKLEIQLKFHEHLKAAYI